MGTPPSLIRRGYKTWKDIADKFEVVCCESGPDGCRKKWGSKIHSIGRVDQIGVVHWNGWGKPANRKGLYKVLILVAYAKNREFREEPEWLGLYHAATWGYAAAAGLGIRFRRTESITTRQAVRALMKRDGVLMKDHPSVRSWVNLPIRDDILYASNRRVLRSKVT